MEPAAPIKIPVLALTILSLGVYVFLAAFMLETYALVVVATACFVAGAAPAFRLLRTHR